MTALAAEPAGPPPPTAGVPTGATPTGSPPPVSSATISMTATPDPIAAERALSITERRHTMAMLEAGIIALPNAPISNSQRGGSVPFTTVGHGDATLQTGVRLLFRGGRDWVVGVGALFGPSPTADDQYGGLKSLPRTHSRNYLVFTGEGRYVPLRAGNFEGWAGIVAGGVIVADRFTTNAGDNVPSIIGTREVTISTEGFVIGVQAGVTWNFAEHWGAGFTLRLNQWVLPNTPQCSPIGDCSTLSGGVQSFDAGLSIGYRIPL